jgi:cytochrome c-type biogenesis protein CcmF
VKLILKQHYYQINLLVINLVQNQEFFNVRYQVKPFMLWIWISVILISVGGLISLCKKEYEK